MSHTKEPWVVADCRDVGHECISIVDKDIDLCIARIHNIESKLPLIDEDLANARRIVACVNACAGMVDPESEVKQLVEYVPALTERMLKAEQQHAELLAKAKKFAQAYDEEAPLFDLYLELMQAIASVESKT